MAKKWFSSVGVKAAAILVVGSIIVAGMHIWNSRSQMAQDNKNYKTEIDQKNTNIGKLQRDLSSKNTEIQRLETQLIPFRTIALDKYTGSESEALQKLASDIGRLQEADQKSKQKIAELEEELKRTADTAAPPTLSLIKEDIRITKSDSGYEIVFPFTSSKNQSLGKVTFTTKIVDDCSAKIIKLSPKGAVMNTRHWISPDGKNAEYSFSTSDSALGIKLEVSGACRVQIEGSHSLKPFEVYIN